jgi:deaminated glutathione amidase
MLPAPDAQSTPEKLELAVVQLSSRDDVTRNLEACKTLVDEAARRGARLVLLPENFAYFGPEAGRREHAERVGDQRAPIQRALSDMARSNGCYVIGGGMPVASDDPARPYNTALVAQPDGQIVASYHKVHLFDVDLADGTTLRESASTFAGDDPVCVDVAGFKIGLSICYDLRFPELYRKLTMAGAELLVVPAAFTLHTGKDHWHVLLRARAIEAQCYVAAAAQWGSHPHGRQTYGHSLVADPWGTVIVECSDGVGFSLATVERSRVRSVRASLPCLAHVRF